MVRDKAFFFLAYDQQEYNETKQTDRLGAIDPALLAFVDTAFGGALQGDFGSIGRTNDANAFLGKLDFRLGQQAQRDAQVQLHQFVAAERHLRRGLLGPQRQRAGARLLPRGQRQPDARSSPPRSRTSSASSGPGRTGPGPTRGRPTRRPGDPSPTPTSASWPPDASFQGYRVGMPFFIPVDAHDYRFQVLDNVSIVSGNHLFKIRGRVEPDRREPRRSEGSATAGSAFTSVNGFLNYVANGNGYVECARTSSTPHAQPDHGRLPGRNDTSPGRWRSTSSRPVSAD